jgi:NifU-like protein involved in Fe-S cluster formation
MGRVNAPLYTHHILRLAVATASHPPLADPMASAEKRSPVCGSTITVDVATDPEGRIGAVGMSVRACALGQASASLMAAAAAGRSGDELAATSEALARWLAGAGPMPDWPGLEALEPALPHSARHGSIRLPFEAVAEAARTAGSKRGAAV